MNVAEVPMKIVGPIKIVGHCICEAVRVPLATFETPLWPSTERGARVSRKTDGIHTVIIDERMTRSVIFEATCAEEAANIMRDMQSCQQEIELTISQTSRFADFLALHFQIVGNLLYVRLECSTGDAAGHNMTTKAADAFIRWALEKYSVLKYSSVSGNYCSDKKVSAVNGILGRGKYVISEMTIPRDICDRILKTSPERMVKLNIEKNLLGSILAGGIRSANAHFANILLAVYLATGQDAANIIEGSQGFVHAALRENDLYFSVTLPNIIVGTIGNGKDLAFVRNNLDLLGCLEKNEVGVNARRLACITAATVLCGELSLLAAMAQPGELVKSHEILERRKKR
jgi:hydroxymethylglutaryl-CoA reductase (NADPH)